MVKDEKIINRIIELNGKMSQNNIAKEVGLSQPTVRAILKRNGIEPISFNNRKYNYNESFFENIDTEEKAYFLGFIMADGYIHYSMTKEKANELGMSDPSKRVSICISYKDVEILEKFQECINLNKDCIRVKTPKGTYSTNKMCTITLNSKKMFDDLVRHGVVQCKTGKEHIPDTVPKHLIKHFIRGFLDGDGTIASRTNYRLITVGLCSSSSKILNQINSHLVEVGCSNRTIHFEKKKNMYYLYYSSINDLFVFYEYIFKDSKIYLSRKRNKYLNSLFS